MLRSATPSPYPRLPLHAHAHGRGPHDRSIVPFPEESLPPECAPIVAITEGCNTSHSLTGVPHPTIHITNQPTNLTTHQTHNQPTPSSHHHPTIQPPTYLPTLTTTIYSLLTLAYLLCLALPALASLHAAACPLPLGPHPCRLLTFHAHARSAAVSGVVASRLRHYR